MVNSKGIKLALKNLGQFSSPTTFRAVLRDKYQHFDLYFKYKTLRILCKKVLNESCEYLYFKGPISTRMRSSLVVRASDCQCTSCNGPGFDPSIRRHSGI